MSDCKFTAENPIVNRYVKSLYEISVSSGIEKIVHKQLELIKNCILAIDGHEKFLKKIFLITELGEAFISQLKDGLKLSPEISNFLKLLLKNKRLPLIIDICNRYFSFVDDIRGKKKFYIAYAKGFSKSDEKQLEDDLRDAFGGEIECISNKDLSLIGGIKIQFRSKILDYSIKSRLAQLRCAIIGGNYEN
ncbi:MAG: ATP synthase F1 subunit delta [Holosporaceae bacterium]|jgi:F-type H+-transporting ATPase subunit delta|nr:ATP synthase F1 subunit delta [Holosporaceae bacterium]